ncbi:hypothetical protein [Massilibacteroides sp.]|uniref:hypothetical protein n=1 Tax=Massilibacteroides sp. TaxID=2034766 RepID=UPI00260DED61|nr:hypothetical protein [Massilibacteroides sp.]MDD4514639.1 hypothetical protein [Massilibacteroides sp.]
MRILFVITLSLLLGASIPVEIYSIGRTEISFPQKQNPKPDVEISFVDNRLKVTNATIGSKLEVYSVVGVKVLEIEIKYPSGDYSVNLSKGYYIVRLGETVRKIVIR